jgi:SAM-dependent methyltransferase
MTSAALDHWSTALRAWGIPDAILASAPQSPWIHPVQSFRPEGDLFVDTPSRNRALEALERTTGHERSVVDVGCGGGRAAFGLTPPATIVVGVDHQQAMLDVFAEEAARRSLDCTTVLGDWQEVASATPSADVVTCHHVLYNVGDLAPFVTALDAHAHQRVVIEIPRLHPLAGLSGLWKHFWDLDRPTSPTALDALEAIRSIGPDARLEAFDIRLPEAPVTDQDVEFTRIRLCLPAQRDAEIRRYLVDHPARTRALATIWWDV